LFIDFDTGTEGVRPARQIRGVDGWHDLTQTQEVVAFEAQQLLSDHFVDHVENGPTRGVCHTFIGSELRLDGNREPFLRPLRECTVSYSLGSLEELFEHQWSSNPPLLARPGRHECKEIEQPRADGVVERLDF